MNARRAARELIDDALDALDMALTSLDIAVGREHRGPRPFDATVDVLVDDQAVAVAVAVKSYCTGPVAREAVAAFGRPRPGVVPLVVADRITIEARDVLSDAGWSWFDRRGRIHVRGPAVRVDADVPVRVRTEAAAAGPAVAGRSGITVAYWLLAHPEESLSPNGHAPTLRLAPSTISTSVRRLADAGLLDDGRRALVPELFWELAAAWRVDRTWLATEPDPMRHRTVDPEAPTWRRTGSAAAAAWGAPVVTGEGGPVELYVPGPVEVSIAVRRYGPAEPGLGAAALAVAPAAPVVAGPADEPAPEVGGWIVAPKLAVALDLAQDRARGWEILNDWVDVDAVWR